MRFRTSSRTTHGLTLDDDDELTPMSRTTNMTTLHC